MANDDIDARLHAFKCPVCKAVTGLPGVNRSFPFCSERCRFVDLGRWIDGRYAVDARTGKLDLVEPSDDDSLRVVDKSDVPGTSDDGES
ncbi:MAG: DNA gyrase inhibitor YacG [Myxococcales bacterium]|nr:DNA gyrase inhibitor YacG [Myxococcales bacterium]